MLMYVDMLIYCTVKKRYILVYSNFGFNDTCFSDESLITTYFSCPEVHSRINITFFGFSDTSDTVTLLAYPGVSLNPKHTVMHFDNRNLVPTNLRVRTCLQFSIYALFKSKLIVINK